MEKTIEIKGIDLAQLIGPADANLKMVEDAFSSQIIVRGSKIKIIGEESEVLFINDVFHEMGATLNRKGSLTQKDVKTLINVNKSQNGNQSNISESTILYGKNGAISARSKGQEDYINKVRNNDIVFSVGPAGTGKTYLAVAFAVSALENREIDRIVLCRPAVEAGENLGFLPGDLKEKVDPYLTPLYDALRSMMPSTRLKPLLSNNTIEIIPLAYMRGRTLNNAFMILDEAQNATTTQMKMFLTRLGVNSKTIITGDVTQVDLPKKSESGLIQVIDLLKKIDGIEFCMLSPSDVVRHKLVKDIIKAYDKQ
jgi:phosphate starvation-inducible PhoH-like protein|tara:strand:- start:408 stop:1340 length:933 start_codon:yes stop_codon:yes gene_type:complete